MTMCQSRLHPARMYVCDILALFQTNVPDVSRLVQRIKIGGQVRGVDGHRSGGQQAVPVRVPPELLAGRGESGSSGAGAALRSPGLAVHRRSATKAGGLVRKGQADEQRHGQARPGKMEKFRANRAPLVNGCRSNIDLYRVLPFFYDRLLSLSGRDRISAENFRTGVCSLFIAKFTHSRVPSDVSNAGIRRKI